MANRRYSGKFLRTDTNPYDNRNFSPDPRHGVGETREYPSARLMPADTGAAFDNTAFPDNMAVGGGSTLGTPNRSHHGRAGRRMLYTDDQYRAQLDDGLHNEDGQHRIRQHLYTNPPLQDHTEVYSDAYGPSMPQPSGPATQGPPHIMRGLNSYPLSNPDGVRDGVHREGPWLRSSRKFGPHMRHRYGVGYTPQPLMQRDIWAASNTPAPGPAPDTQNFTAWNPSGMFTFTKRRGALFRAPQEFDTTSLAAEPLGTSDVIGGGVV